MSLPRRSSAADPRPRFPGLLAANPPRCRTIRPSVSARRRAPPDDRAMTRVLHRHLHRKPPVAVGGTGMFLTDAEGRRYLDACGGAAVS